MEKMYSVDFFKSFIESLQGLCQQYLNYNQFVEVSGYLCVEIDNMKKERYVLSELLQSSGNVVSESYCTKAFKTAGSDWLTSQSPLTRQQFCRKDLTAQRNKENCVNSNQSTSACSQPVFPRRTNSDSMMPPVSPVLSIQNLENVSSINRSKERVQTRSVDADFDIDQFNIQRPVHGQMECYTEGICTSTPQSAGATHKSKRRKVSSYPENTPLQSPTSASSQSYSSESEVSADLMRNPVSDSSSEIQVTLPRTLSDDGVQRDAGASKASSADGAEIIDLDMFDDEFENFPTDSSFQLQESSLSELKSDFTFDVSKMVSQSQKKVTNPGSLSVLRSVVKRFKQYHFEKSGQDIEPLDIAPEQLNEMLLDFFMGAKKMDGSYLTVGSLKNTQVYLERYLKQGGYPYSITRDNRFKPCRDYIKARQEESNRSKVLPKHVPVDDDDIEMMFQKDILGVCSPDSLFNTLWLLNSKFFAKKKPGEHFNMKWGEVRLNTNEVGEEFLERPINDAFSLKVFAKPNNPSRCFVNFYKRYRDMRPKGTLNSDYAFYLKINKNPGHGAWFLPEPMMWSPFTYVWKKIVVSSGLSLNKRLL